MSVESYFQSRAEQFNRLYHFEGGWREWFNRRFRAGLYQRVELTLQEFTGLQNVTVLDVGCGSGRNAELFAESGAEKITGIDFSSTMIGLSRELGARSTHSAKLTFIHGDFLEHHFSEMFDVIVALGVFDYTRDPVSMLRKMAQLAKLKVIGSFPGISAVRAPLRKVRYGIRGCPVYFYTRRRLDEIFASAGLPKHRIVPCSSGFVVVGEVASAPKEVS